MFSLNPAALLSIQLLVMCQGFTVSDLPEGHWDILVFRGDSVMFTCNISKENIKQINWTKGRALFAYFITHNRTSSNLTSHRLRIDINLPSKLNISNVQHDDAGLYKCTLNDRRGAWYAEWNLTVWEKPDDRAQKISSSWYFLYILTSVFGLLLCGITAAVCLCRKNWTKTPNQDLVRSRTLSYVEFRVQLGGASLQVAPPQLQSRAEYTVNHRKYKRGHM